MRGMKDGFKRGTNDCHRQRMSSLGAIQGAEIVASLARSAIAITPMMRCGKCGHLASEHDLDRTTLLPGEEVGGAGCIKGWCADSDGCDCEQFTVDLGVEEAR